jgi:hypothetical protein
MNTRSTLLSAALVAVVLGALYAWTVAPTIAVLHDTVDSAELVSVAAVLGVAHPTGEAIWLPIARLALEVVPADEPALRTNLLSVVLMALASALVAVAARRWRPETPWWGAAIAGLLFGLAPVVWAQAIVTEVYALQAVLAALALVLGADAIEGQRWRPFALVLGLLVASHLTGLALAVPLLVVAVIGPRSPRGREAAWCAGLFILPLLYCAAYLWLRADAEIAWGETGTVRGLLDHLGGSLYRDSFDRTPQTVLAAVPATVRKALQQLPPPVWLLLIPGALAIARTRVRLALVLLTWASALALFISGYLVRGREDYLQGTTMVLALVAGWGAVEVWGWMAERLTERTARVSLGLVVAGLFAVWAVWVGDTVSLRGDTTLVDEARARLVDVAEFGHVSTERDRETFPLWYVTTVLGERSDVTIIDIRLNAPAVGPRR